MYRAWGPLANPTNSTLYPVAWEVITDICIPMWPQISKSKQTCVYIFIRNNVDDYNDVFYYSQRTSSTIATRGVR